ncbi:MAG: DciA family protein [Dinoroseobacter sp.]|nr:DciA family protein [Dinoroseobacter sp.]
MAVSPRQRGGGFKQTGRLLEVRIREAGEGRGFVVARLLTHWDEIAGPDLATQCRPVNVGYSRKGFGATLTVLTTGAFAPLLQAQLPRLRERVNGCYGYNAISRIRITQTAPSGFADAPAQFDHASARPAPSATCTARAVAQTSDIQNAELRQALAQLGAQILSKTPSRT